MKTAETKTASPAIQRKAAKPFFGKGGDAFFGRTGDKESAFFSPTSPVQAKLTVGEPDDPFEKEADAMADKVVKGDTGTEGGGGDGNMEKEEEKKIQTKEEDNREPLAEKVRLKPIFESEAEPAVQKKAIVKENNTTPPASNTTAPAIALNQAVAAPAKTATVQAKCTACEQEEKLETEEENGELQKKIYRKPVFAASAEPPDDEMAVQRKCTACAEEEQSLISPKKMPGPTGAMPATVVQRACRECEEGDKVLMKPVPGLQRDAYDQTPKKDGSRESIVAAAKGELGKVEARINDGTGNRVGADRLLEYFHIAAPGVWDDSIIETAGAAMPSWCGIFSVWAHKKAGKDVGDWQMGKGVSAFGTLTTTDDPRPGDIGYVHDPNQHHAVVKEVAGDTVHTIDGNSGLNSEVIENTKPRSDYDLFLTAFGGNESGDIQAKEEGPDSTVQAKSGNDAATVPSSIESRISSSKGNGSELPGNTRQEMESSFGADFSGVRIHSDSSANELSSNLNAQAFTHGNDIYFNSGKYDTSGTEGKLLLAHELTHTIQQGASLSRQPVVQKQDPDEEVESIAETVYDALDGWTDSDDSATILSELNGKNKSTLDLVIGQVAASGDITSVEVLEWMRSDMVASDWNTLRGHMVSHHVQNIEKIIAAEIDDRISGYTSDDDSREIVQLFAGDAPILGDQLTLVLQQLEAVTEENSDETASWLLDDLTLVHADTLCRHFFGSGSLKGIQYAARRVAKKVKDLIAGYTGIDDSSMIVLNFERVPEAMRSYVLFQLDQMCNEEWEQPASQALMEDMQQSDYERLRELMPGLLPVYNIELNWLEWLWDKVTVGFDYVVSFLEYAVCGIAGIIWGILLIVRDILVLVWDLVLAIKNTIGWIINKISGGTLAREEAESFENFFTGMGQFFGAPGEAISHMWDEMVLESTLIEGPFRECQQAFYWVSRIANFIVNIVLIFFFGYGAVKLVLEAIKGVATLIKAGQLLAALGRLPGRMMSAIKGLPGAVARATVSGVGRVISLIRNPIILVESARNTIAIIRLAATDEGFFTFLRQQAGRAIGDEAQFWRDQRAFWTRSSERAGEDLTQVEGKLVQAVDTAVDDPARAEGLVAEAEQSARVSQSEADDLLNEIKGTGAAAVTDALEARLPEMWRQGMPGRPPMLNTCITRLRAAGITDDTIVAIVSNAALHSDYRAADFFGDLNRFLLRIDTHVGRDGFNTIIAGLAGDQQFLAARFLMLRVSFGQNIIEVLRIFTLDDITMLRARFPSGSDAEFVNNLRGIVTRINGSRDDIMNLLNEAGEGQQAMDNLTGALDRLGEGSYTPDQVRQSLAFGAELQQAIARSADEVARTIWGDAFAGRDANGRILVSEALTRDRAGDLASAHIRARRSQIAAAILRGEGGTELDAVTWGVIREVLLNTDLPTIVKNDILGEIWAFTKVQQYENLGYLVIREVHIRILNPDGTESGTFAKVDAVLRRGDDLLYREFKASATAETSPQQDAVYDLLNQGAVDRLRPFGSNAENAFGGPGMPEFRAGPVVIERPPN